MRSCSRNGIWNLISCLFICTFSNANLGIWDCKTFSSRIITGEIYLLDRGTAYSIGTVSKRDSLQGRTSRRRGNHMNRSRIRIWDETYPEDPFPTTGKQLLSAAKLFNGRASRSTKQGTEVEFVSSIYNYLLAVVWTPGDLNVWFNLIDTLESGRFDGEISGILEIMVRWW